MKRPFFVILIQKKIYMIVVMSLLLFLAVEFELYGISVICVGNTSPLHGKKIVIDPGHGGIDGGTNCPGFLEKEVNLAVAKKLREKLTRLGAQVILTREQDIGLDQLNSISSSRHKRDLHPGFPPTHNEVGGVTPKLLYSSFCFSRSSPIRIF